MRICRSVRATLILLGLVFFCLATWSARAETVEIGFPAFDKEMNLLLSNHPAAKVARAALTRALTFPEAAPPGYRMHLGDTLTVSSDLRTWSFRIAQHASFSNGAKILERDLAYSMLRCQKDGVFSGIERILTRKAHSRDSRLIDTWVDFSFEDDSVASEGAASEGAASEGAASEGAASEGAARERAGIFPLEVAECPIIEGASSELFGSDLGYGSNLVGSGEYAISELWLGNSMTLQRIGNAGSSRQGAQSVVLRGFADPKRGLTAIRTGTLVAFFTQDAEVLGLAGGDETLLVERCLGDQMIRRRSVSIPCSPALSVSQIKFSG